MSSYFWYLLGYEYEELPKADEKQKYQKYLVCKQIKNTKHFKLKKVKFKNHDDVIFFPTFLQVVKNAEKKDKLKKIKKELLS